MKLFKFIFIIALLGTLSACASSRIADRKVITAHGIGRAAFVPDIINLRITVTNMDDSLLAAVSRTEKTVIEFLAVCNKFNMPDRDIHRTNIISTKHNIYNNETNKMDLIRYETINAIQISIKNLAVFEKFSDKILQLAGLTVEEFFFTHSNVAQYETDANLLALNDAKSKAEKIAEHLGLRLGEILDVSYPENKDLNKYWDAETQGFYWPAVTSYVLPVITLSQRIQVKYSVK